MNKSIIKKLLTLIIIAQLIIPISLVQAETLGFPHLQLELSIPEDVIVITADTPKIDEKWAIAGIENPAAEIDTMRKMGAHSIFFDSITNTQVSLLSKQSKQSKDIFHLSDLNEKELDAFLATIINSQDDIATYSVDKYIQKEATFFRLHIEATQNDQKYEELVYGTIVNGTIITFHIFQNNKSEAINESFIKALIDSAHFTEYFDKEDVKEQERLASIFQIVLFILILISLIVWFLLLKRKNNKQKEIIKYKANELSKFYLKKKDLGDNNAHDIVLFNNYSNYSKSSLQTFFVYNEVFSKIKQWIKLAVLYIITHLLFNLGKYGFLTYLLLILIISVIIIAKTATIAKLVEREMKLLNISDSIKFNFQFYDDYLSMCGENKSLTFPYMKITKVSEHKNYIYLYLDANKALCLDKDGFNQKTEEFKAFIKKKTDFKI